MKPVCQIAAELNAVRQPPQPVHRPIELEEQHHALLFRVIVHALERYRKNVMYCVTLFESSHVRSWACFITSIR